MDRAKLDEWRQTVRGEAGFNGHPQALLKLMQVSDAANLAQLGRAYPEAVYAFREERGDELPPLPASPDDYPRCPCRVVSVDVGFYADDIRPRGELKPGQLGDVCGAAVAAVEVGALIREKPGMPPAMEGPSPAGERYRCTEGHWFAVVDGVAVPAGPPEDITIREDIPL